MADLPDQSKRLNMHACLVQLDGKGVLITGRSGSGKTSLSLGLIEAFHKKNKPASMVGDDQILVSLEDGKLIGEVPDSIAGMVEVSGFGVTKIDYIPRSNIDLHACLEPDEKIQRMPEKRFETMIGQDIPSISVPERHENQAIRIIQAKMADLFD